MFGGNFRNLLIIFIAIMLINGFLNFSQEELLSTLLTLPGLVLALTVHEYAHAKTSDKYGDPTPENEGRLTLNPLKHMDPVGTICLLFAGFGWGKPVNINPSYYRDPAKESAKVAAAGPISNFILAFGLFFLYGILAYASQKITIPAVFIMVVLYGAYINLSLGVFNLLPFPPLDGSKIFGYFLKGKAKEVLWTLEKYSTIILIVLFATRLPSLIISPIIEFVANVMITIVGFIFGLFM